MLSRRSITSPIGLDIATQGVRAAQVTRNGHLWEVSHTVSATHIGEDRGDTPNPDQSAATVRRCLSQTRFRGREAVVALGTPDLECHTLELPETVARSCSIQASQVVDHEVGRLMSYDQGSVETRHWALPASSAGGPNAIGVAAPRGNLEVLLATCAQAGLACRSVDTASAALSRFGLALHPASSDEVWGILDLGERQARLTLCLGDVPVLVRTVGDGGRAWTELIAESLQISFQAAEVHKCEHGIALGGRGGRQEERLHRLETGATRRELASMILGVLRGELNRLAAEVKRSYEYALSCYPQRQAADLILVGGGAATRNVAAFLGNALGIRVGCAASYLEDESCRLRCALQHRDSVETLALAIGLALEAQPSKELSNEPRASARAVSPQ